MTTNEFHRLIAYYNCKLIERSHRPTVEHIGRRQVKGQAKGYGSILKQSYVKGQVKLMECNK